MANKLKDKNARKDTGLPISSDMEALIVDLTRMIDDARSAVAVVVNASLTFLYWQVGLRINTEILKGDRAEYGKQILATVSQQLAEHYGKGFSYSYHRVLPINFTAPWMDTAEYKLAFFFKVL